MIFLTIIGLASYFMIPVYIWFYTIDKIKKHKDLDIPYETVWIVFILEIAILFEIIINNYDKIN
jgi:hypothetical protein